MVPHHPAKPSGLVELPLAVVGVAEALAKDVEAEDLGQDSVVEAPPVAALEVKAKDASEVEEEVVASVRQVPSDVEELGLIILTKLGCAEQDAHDTPPEAGIHLYSLLHPELGCGVEGQLAPGEVGVHSSNDALQDSLQLGVKLDPKVAAGGGLEQGYAGHLPKVEVLEALALASPCNKGVQVVL
ncbi:hypothetical protein O988_01627 [Pseudogymnoascus sp. VKM F-3808]|nr:hypothetical protein O988_01627 [Pseudogymnoascus sp. VKM F-3808]